MTARILRTAAVMAGLVPLASVVSSLPASAQATPTITWNTYLGGGTADGGFSATTDEPQGIITNRTGETFVVGRTNSPLFPNTPPPLAPTGGFGGYDAFVTRLHADGGVAWTRVFGGTGDDVAMRVALVPSSETHLYVVGTTESPASSLGGVAQKFGDLKGGKDAFVARLELNGTLSWFKYLDGAGLDEGRDISIFNKFGVQRVYVTGNVAGDVVVSQVDDTLDGGPNVMWNTTFGSPLADEAYAVLTTDFHQVLVGGSVGTSVPDSFLPRPRNDYGGGRSDGFIAQLEPDGGMKWFQYAGGSGEDDVRDLLYQPDLNGGTTTVVVGNSTSLDFPVGFDRKGSQIFLLRIVGDNGTIQDRKLVIGRGGESMTGHAGSDVKGNVFIGGTTTSSTLALNAFDKTPDLSGKFKDDGFVAMVHRELEGVIWASYVGGASDTSEAVTGLVSVPPGQLTFVGSTSADAGVLVVNAGHDLTANGGQDGYVFRLAVDADASVPPSPEDAGTGADGGSSATDSGTSGPDAGMPGVDAGTPGADGGTSEDEELSPLGWSCGSTGGGGLVGTFALLAVALLLSRRASS
jgi:hypothetical protein